MPLHDWSRVEAGVFHHFHTTWIGRLAEAFNVRLSSEYYAMSEQRVGNSVPDVLALRAADFASPAGAATALAPRPTTRFRSVGYTGMQRTIVVRHAAGDRIVAILEIASRGNKSSQAAENEFTDKCARFLRAGVHVSVIDIVPHPPRCPHGLHAALWGRFDDAPYESPAGQPLAVAAYEAGDTIEAYVEPLGIAESLPDLAVFLERGGCVMAPLEETYMAAFASVPLRWRQVIETPAA